MNVLEKINALKERFEISQGEINEHYKAIQSLQDQQKSMQGEYKILREMGIEEGVLDEEGMPVEAKE